MLEVHAVLLEHLKHLAHRSALVVDAVFFNVYRREALAPRHAGDSVLGGLVSVGKDKRAGVLRGVGVLYSDRNFLLHDGEYRVLVNNSRAHIRKLAQLPVCNGLHDLRIINDARVGDEEARDIRPVLIEIGIGRRRNYRTCYIRTAARKCADSIIGHRTVETGNDCVLSIAQALAQNGYRALCVVFAALVEEYDICGIYKREAEQLCDYLAVEILASRCGIVAAGAPDKIEAYMLKIIFERHIEPESGNYIVVAVLYLLEYLFKIAASRCGIVAGVEHIGNFCISAETLAGRRRHDIAAVGI